MQQSGAASDQQRPVLAYGRYTPAQWRWSQGGGINPPSLKSGRDGRDNPPTLQAKLCV